MRTAWTVWLAVAVCVVTGCSRHQQTATDAAQQNQAADNSAESGPTTFDPADAQPLRNSEIRGDSAAAYDAAAAASARYFYALAYERQMILNRALPPIQGMLALNAKNLRQDARAENLATLLMLDYRFDGIAQRDEVQKLLAAATATPPALMSSPVKIQVTDPGGLPPPAAPSVSDGPQASVSRLGPDSVVRGVGQFGDALADKGREMNLDAVLQREVERLLAPALAKGADYQRQFQMLTSDSVETRAAKLGLKSAFDDFLSQIVTYKGSYFLGMQTTNGLVQIWEFKQPIVITASRSEADARTRMNMGIEMMAVLNFSAAGTETLQRCYASGWWTSWTTFPELGSINLTKAGDWTLERSATFRSRRCFRLSVAELDMALSRSDTTKLVAQAEATVSPDDTGNSDPASLLTLLESATAHGDLDGATSLGDRLVRTKAVSPRMARSAAGMLADVLYARNPVMTGDFYKSVLFDTGGPRGTGDPSEWQMLAVTEDTSNEPVKPPFPRQELANLAACYEIVTQNEPDNADASFDLALVYDLEGSGKDTLEKSAEALRSALDAAKKHPPASGRDFHRIATETATFFPLALCSQNDTEPFMDSVTYSPIWVLRFRPVYKSYGY